jgi:hypothetical protein
MDTLDQYISYVDIAAHAFGPIGSRVIYVLSVLASMGVAAFKLTFVVNTLGDIFADNGIKGVSPACVSALIAVMVCVCVRFWSQLVHTALKWRAESFDTQVFIPLVSHSVGLYQKSVEHHCHCNSHTSFSNVFVRAPGIISPTSKQTQHTHTHTHRPPEFILFLACGLSRPHPLPPYIAGIIPGTCWEDRSLWLFH